MAAAAAAAAAAAIAADAALGSFSPVSAAIMLVAAGLGCAAALFARRTAAAVAKMTGVCKDIDRGNFEARLTNVTEGGDVGELMFAIDDMIDRADAYVRESAASLGYVAENKYFRRILEKGMTGNFLNASRAVNAAAGAIEKKVKDFGKVSQAFEANVKTVISTVASAATELQSTAESMESIAKTTS